MDRLLDVKVELSMLKDKPDYAKLVTITPKYLDDIEWLIEQTEKTKQYEKALKEIVATSDYNGFKLKEIAKKAIDS